MHEERPSFLTRVSHSRLLAAVGLVAFVGAFGVLIATGLGFIAYTGFPFTDFTDFHRDIVDIENRAQVLEVFHDVSHPFQATHEILMQP